MPNLLHMFSQCCELWHTSGWVWFTSLGHPSKFQRVSHVRFVTAPTSFSGRQPNFAQCFAVSWLVHYMHFRGLLPPKGILPDAKFTLRPTLALFCIGSITARHSSSGCQANFAVLSRGHHLYVAGRPSRRVSAHILVNICGFAKAWEYEHFNGNP